MSMSMPLPELGSPVSTPLEAHFEQCTFETGAAHQLHCMIEAIKGFAAPRMVSLLIAASLLLSVVLSWPFGSL